MNMAYNKDCKKAYIEQAIHGFANELRLIYKHKVKSEVGIEQWLFEYLESGFILNKRETKKIIKEAVKIANEHYGLNIEISQSS